MLKKDVVAVFGTASALAQFLGIEKSAVSQWGEEIPKLRQYELREKRPSIDREIAQLQGQATA